MNKLPEKDICDKWLLNKTINPLTMRKISETGSIYKKLVKKCRPTAEKDICDKWLQNKKINPETMRKISETGAIYKKLVKKCLEKKR